MLSQLYQEGLLGSRARAAAIPVEPADPRFTWFLVLGSVMLAAVYLFTDGTMFTAVTLVGATAAIVLTMYRVDWGLMLFVGVVLMFDETPPRGYDRSIIGKEYFQNLKSLPFFRDVASAVMNPLEIHLFLVVAVFLLLIVLRKRVMLSRVDGWLTALCFFGWILVSAVSGIARGGDFLPALWEIRALFYLGCLFFLVPQVIQSKEQIRQMFWVVIAALAFKTMQGMIRVANLGFDFGRRDELTSHEDPLFLISMFVLMSALYINRERIAQRTVLVWGFVPMLMVFLLAQRRATWAALAVSIVAFFFLLEGRHRAAFARFLVPAAAAGVIYLAVFWTSPSGGIGHAAFLVRSSFATTRAEAGERYWSNLYRKMEDYDLAQTVKRAPLAGIGFGNKYDQPLKLFRIGFPLAEYIPHNEIFWVFVKTGAVGYLLFWIFLFSAVFRTAAVSRVVSDPYLKSVCMVIMIAALGQVVVSFFDLQLTYSRNMVYLGTLLGLYPAILRTHVQTESLPRN